MKWTSILRVKHRTAELKMHLLVVGYTIFDDAVFHPFSPIWSSKLSVKNPRQGSYPPKQSQVLILRSVAHASYQCTETYDGLFQIHVAG